LHFDIAHFWRHQRVRKIRSLRDNGLFDEVFGNEWEILRDPSVDPGFEWANAGDSFGSTAAAPHGRCSL
jgi:hypothetical protein